MVNGGARSFGFAGNDRSTGQPVAPERVEAERAALAQAAEEVAAGLPVARVVARWNEAGLTTATGRPWTGVAVREVLCRGRNAGLVEHNGVTVSRADGEPIISEELLSAVRAVFAARRRGRAPGERYLGSGLVHCGACSQPLSGRPHNGTYADGEPRRQYCCQGPNGCGKVAADARRVDAELERFTVERLSDARHASRVAAAHAQAADRLAAVDRELSEARAVHEGLGDRLGRGEIPLAAFDAAMRSLRPAPGRAGGRAGRADHRGSGRAGRRRAGRRDGVRAVGRCRPDRAAGDAAPGAGAVDGALPRPRHSARSVGPEPGTPRQPLPRVARSGGLRRRPATALGAPCCEFVSVSWRCGDTLPQRRRSVLRQSGTDVRPQWFVAVVLVACPSWGQRATSTTVDTDPRGTTMGTFSPPRLRAVRNVAGLTRPQLAERADLSPLTITGYEHGKSIPSAAALGKLADTLGCRVDDFYDGGRDAQGEYWAAACAALPPLSDETCRAVGLIFRQIDAARAARAAASGTEGGAALHDPGRPEPGAPTRPGRRSTSPAIAPIVTAPRRLLRLPGSRRRTSPRILGEVPIHGEGERADGGRASQRLARQRQPDEGACQAHSRSPGAGQQRSLSMPPTRSIVGPGRNIFRRAPAIALTRHAAVGLAVAHRAATCRTSASRRRTLGTLIAWA